MFGDAAGAVVANGGGQGQSIKLWFSSRSMRVSLALRPSMQCSRKLRGRRQELDALKNVVGDERFEDVQLKVSWLAPI